MMIRWWVRVAHGDMKKPTRSACVIASSSLWFRSFSPIHCDSFSPIHCSSIIKLVKGNWVNWRNLRRYHYNLVRRDVCPDRKTS